MPPCDELVAHLPNVSAALCRDALLVPGPARSVKGRSILLRDMPSPDAKLRVLVLGGMHFFNLVVFTRMRKRATWHLTPPPVPPAGVVNKA